MPVCPSCKTEQSKRKEGRCPNCGALVEPYGKHWYLKSLGNPAVSILEYFERKVSVQLTAGRPVPVPFSIARKSERYKRELKYIGTLLANVEGDYNLVIETLDILFSDRRFNFKTRTSITYFTADWDAALALARANRAQKELEAKKVDKVLARLEQAENIFA